MGEWKKWSQEEIPLNFLTKSDFLDMLGVKIYSNYTETRQKNGEMLVKGVKETIDRWKSGKFMAFTDRTSCVNTYVLSKIWYKTSAIDFNKGDFEKITSYIKSWLYQDSLLKPDEILIYRKIADGGLGLFHIESKSKANFIVSFLQSATNPNFSKSLLHQSIYDFYLKGEGVKAPFCPPYISKDIISIIKKAMDEKLDIYTMKSKEWYHRLLEKNVTHYFDSTTENWIRINSRIEFLFPHIDHDISIKNIRKSHLPSRISSTLYKLKYDLLNTNERLFNCSLRSSNRCNLCSRVDNQGHFLICGTSPIKNINENFIKLIHSTWGHLSLEKIVHLDISGEDNFIYSLSWILALITDHCFSSKKVGNEPDPIVLHSILVHNLRIFEGMYPEKSYKIIISHLSYMIKICNI